MKIRRLTSLIALAGFLCACFCWFDTCSPAAVRRGEKVEQAALAKYREKKARETELLRMAPAARAARQARQPGDVDLTGVAELFKEEQGAVPGAQGAGGPPLVVQQAGVQGGVGQQGKQAKPQRRPSVRPLPQPPAPGAAGLSPDQLAEINKIVCNTIKGIRNPKPLSPNQIDYFDQALEVAQRLADAIRDGAATEAARLEQERQVAEAQAKLPQAPKTSASRGQVIPIPKPLRGTVPPEPVAPLEQPEQQEEGVGEEVEAIGAAAEAPVIGRRLSAPPTTQVTPPAARPRRASAGGKREVSAKLLLPAAPVEPIAPVVRQPSLPLVSEPPVANIGGSGELPPPPPPPPAEEKEQPVAKKEIARLAAVAKGRLDELETAIKAAKSVLTWRVSDPSLQECKNALAALKTTTDLSLSTAQKAAEDADAASKKPTQIDRFNKLNQQLTDVTAKLETAQKTAEDKEKKAADKKVREEKEAQDKNDRADAVKAQKAIDDAAKALTKQKKATAQASLDQLAQQVEDLKIAVSGQKATGILGLGKKKLDPDLVKARRLLNALQVNNVSVQGGHLALAEAAVADSTDAAQEAKLKELKKTIATLETELAEKEKVLGEAMGVTGAAFGASRAPAAPLVAQPAPQPEAKKEEPAAQPAVAELAATEAKLKEAADLADLTTQLTKITTAMNDAVAKAGRSLNTFQTTQQMNIPALEKAKIAVQADIDAAQTTIDKALQENIPTSDATKKLQNIKTNVGTRYSNELRRLKAKEQDDLAKDIQKDIDKLPEQPDLVVNINPILIKIIGLSAPADVVTRLKGKVQDPVKAYIEAARQVIGSLVADIKQAAPVPAEEKAQ